jgi:vancomycin resistance protein YoaR
MRVTTNVLWCGLYALLSLPLAWLISDPQEGLWPGVTVAGVEAEGVATFADLRAACQGQAVRLAARPLTLVAGQQTCLVTARDFVAVPTPDDGTSPFVPEVAAARAWLVGREPSLTKRLYSRLRARAGITLGMPVQLEEVRLARVLRRMETPACDATATWVTGRVALSPDRPGVTLPVAQARESLERALAQGRAFAVVPYSSVSARVTVADLHQVRYLRASVTVPLTSSNPTAHRNAALAAKALESVVLLPGEVLSLNQALGKRTAGKGYGAAPVFINQRADVALGGGICPVASAVFQAAALADLEIVERHPHSRRVRYAQPGLDATLNWGTKDLKIRNNSSAPVVFRVTGTNRQVTCLVIGAPLARNVRLVTQSDRSGRTLRVATYRVRGTQGELLCRSRYRL